MTVEGRFGDVSVDAEGASSVLIAGLEKKATLSLGGLPTVAITANNGGEHLLILRSSSFSTVANGIPDHPPCICAL